MSKPANKTMIGAFVVGAIALIVVAIGVLGSGKLFKVSVPFLMVFEGSVKGLNVGSPVVFRGVKTGAVSSIRMRFDYATKAMTIVVYVDSDPSQIETVNLDVTLAEEIKRHERYAIMQQLIARGLRAQLEMQSIVTGQLQIALDFYPDKPAVYTGIDKTIQEIPTIPTPLQELTKKLESLPIEEIFKKLDSALDGIAKLVQSPELKESVVNLNTALKDVQSLVRNVDAQVKPVTAGLSETIRDTQKLVKNVDTQVASLGPNLNEGIGDARKVVGKVGEKIDPLFTNVDEMIGAATVAIKKAEDAMAQIASSTENDSLFMYRATEALKEIESTLRSIRVLVDYFERHPEAILRGKGGN
jgi:paraquat-inducible protein B